MTLVAEGTPVTRETIDLAVEAIALSCARGVRQHGAIVSLIENGQLTARKVWIAGRQFKLFDGGLSWKSWTGMRDRLKAAGFSVVEEKLSNGEISKIRLYWGARFSESL